jgi:predicted nucleotidyltransferase
MIVRPKATDQEYFCGAPFFTPTAAISTPSATWGMWIDEKGLAMRLTAEQADTIHSEVTELLGPEARVYLFGSRVDDSRRGGDIDIYIETPILPQPRSRLKAVLLRRLWERLGTQRIDLLIRADAEALRPIHLDALEQGIRL